MNTSLKEMKRFGEDQWKVLILISLILTLIIFSFFSLALAGGESPHNTSTQVISLRMADTGIETYSAPPALTKDSPAKSNTKTINP